MANSGRATFSLVVSFFLIGTACARKDLDLKACAENPRVAEAVAECSRAIDSGRLSTRDLATALYNRGSAHQQQGELDRAIQDFDRVISLRPDTSKAVYNRAIAYLNKGEPRRAIEDLDRVIELCPDYALGFRNRGNAYRRLLAFDRAIQDYDHAIQLTPTYAEAFHNRGVALLNKHAFKTALEDLDRASGSRPSTVRHTGTEAPHTTRWGSSSCRKETWPERSS